MDKEDLRNVNAVKGEVTIDEDGKEGVWIAVTDSLGDMKENGHYTEHEWQQILERIGFHCQQYKKAKKSVGGKKAAQMFNKFIDSLVKEFILDQTEERPEHKPACGKGCSHCCYMHTTVTIDEAELLYDSAKEKDWSIDWDRLEVQAENTFDTWHTMDKKDWKCVFLGNDGTCQVYDNRPSACRRHLVFTDPIHCSVEDAEDAKRTGDRRIGRIVSVPVEAACSGSLSAVEAENMGKMMLKIKDEKDGLANT